MKYCPVSQDIARYYAELDRIGATLSNVERVKLEYLISSSGRKYLLEDNDVQQHITNLIDLLCTGKHIDVNEPCENLRKALYSAAERLAKRTEEREHEAALALALARYGKRA